MRTALLALTCLPAFGLTAYLSARSETDPVKLRLRLADGESSKGMSGMVRVFPRSLADGPPQAIR